MAVQKPHKGNFGQYSCRVGGDQGQCLGASSTSSPTASSPSISSPPPSQHNPNSSPTSMPFVLPPLGSQTDLLRNLSTTTSTAPSHLANQQLGSVLTFINGMPVLLDLGRLVELVQTGASINLFHPQIPHQGHPSAAGSASSFSPLDGPFSIVMPSPSRQDQPETESRESKELLQADLLGNTVWPLRLAELQAFHSRYGHCNVRSVVNSEEWGSLAQWLDNIKARWAYSQDFLSAEQLTRLGVEPLRQNQSTGDSTRYGSLPDPTPHPLVNLMPSSSSLFLLQRAHSCTPGYNR